MEPLTPKQQNELKTYETAIQAGIRGFYQAGYALASIRQLRLYRENHASFEEYCQNRWNMGRRYANSLISGFRAVKSLGNHGSHQWNERQARELARIPRKKRKLVVNRILKTHARITAQAIRKEWHQLSGQAKREAQFKERDEWLEDLGQKVAAAEIPAPESARCSVYAEPIDYIDEVGLGHEMAYWEEEEAEHLAQANQADAFKAVAKFLSDMFEFITGSKYLDPAKIAKAMLIRITAIIYNIRPDLLDESFPGNTQKKIAKNLGIEVAAFQHYVKRVEAFTKIKNAHQKSDETRARMSQAKKESFSAKAI